MSDKESSKSPIRGIFPDRNLIICKDCQFRNKAVVKIGSNFIDFGATKDFCKKYQIPPNGGGKPIGILINYDMCDFYKKEEKK